MSINIWSLEAEDNPEDTRDFQPKLSPDANFYPIKVFMQVDVPEVQHAVPVKREITTKLALPSDSPVTFSLNKLIQ